MQRALAAHRRGAWTEAESLLRQALAANADDFDALQMLGIIAALSRRPGEAAELLSRAVYVNPGSASAHVNRGNVLQDLGRHDEALACFDRALAIRADSAEAHSNRGNLLRKLRRYEEAMACHDRALAIRPGYARAHCNRGGVLEDLERYDEALACYARALAISPDYAEAHCNRGVALEKLGRHQEALACFDSALAIRPDYAEAHCNRGGVLEKLRRYEDALASVDRALAIKPDYAEALCNRGVGLERLARYEEALDSYDCALAIQPGLAEVHCNRGVALDRLGRYEEALACYDRALALRPGYVEAHTNRGVALEKLARYEEALASFDRAVAISPGYADAHFDASCVRLLLGDFARGWEEHEWRLQTEQGRRGRRDLGRPLWLGRESLQGRTILLHSEQGYGDTVQFCRYARLVGELGAHVVLEVEAPLLALLKDLAGVGQVVAKGAALPAFDCHCPLLSLPLAFRTTMDTIPAAQRYIAADAGKVAEWRAKLGPGTKPRIGLAWSGRGVLAGRANTHRNIPLGDFARLLRNDCEHLSLQKEVNDADRQVLDTRADIHHFGEQLKDFADTAALCELVDVVVSIDTSVAHVAGAMGKPVWILLPFDADWRWLRHRDDSPWYPTARLFRQPARGDWASVIAAVQERLTRERLHEAARAQAPA